MQAGQLRHRITIETPTEVNTNGSLSSTWATLATVWAAVEPLTGREYFQTQQSQSTVSTRIRIRNRTDVTPQMRVLFDGRYFEIETLIHDRTNARELILMCREVQDA